MPHILYGISNRILLCIQKLEIFYVCREMTVMIRLHFEDDRWFEMELGRFAWCEIVPVKSIGWSLSSSFVGNQTLSLLLLPSFFLFLLLSFSLSSPSGATSSLIQAPIQVNLIQSRSNRHAASFRSFTLLVAKLSPGLYLLLFTRKSVSRQSTPLRFTLCFQNEVTLLAREFRAFFNTGKYTFF